MIALLLNVYDLYHMNINMHIKELREGKRLSQTELADAIGISYQSYWKIENGKTELTINRLNQIAKVLEVSLEELLGVEGKGGAGDEKRVKELEKRVKELEDTIELYKESNQALKKSFELLKEVLVKRINVDLIDIAFDAKIIRSDNAKGVLTFHPKEHLWYLSDEVNATGFDWNKDILISRILNDDELMQVIDYLSLNGGMSDDVLSFLIRNGLIDDPILISAFKKFQAKLWTDSGFRLDENGEWIEVEE